MTKQAPHLDKIVTDSGWTTVEKGNCYFKVRREVVFDNATEDQIKEFADFERSKMYGQLKKAEIKGMVVTLVHAVDSGG